ncbi:putative proline-rich receptor-like protein kinase PERK13 [Iris pallida]|uniref:Proline-rich receptor-like protein kinase PERK13 n=1 Tax=Iris pallida TaxID=29817 RepID=A0AAX6EXQ5_IRIPA|nr:putative proline-rich receptor-like protein kinase PERK13 [Iris pallida]
MQPTRAPPPLDPPLAGLHRAAGRRPPPVPLPDFLLHLLDLFLLLSFSTEPPLHHEPPASTAASALVEVRRPHLLVEVVAPCRRLAGPATAAASNGLGSEQREQAARPLRARACVVATSSATCRRGRSLPLGWAPLRRPLGSIASLPGATYRRFVRFERRPVVTRAK